jgi:hypothetical protein
MAGQALLVVFFFLYFKMAIILFATTDNRHI